MTVRYRRFDFAQGVVSIVAVRATTSDRERLARARGADALTYTGPRAGRGRLQDTPELVFRHAKT